MDEPRDATTDMIELLKARRAKLQPQLETATKQMEQVRGVMHRIDGGIKTLDRLIEDLGGGGDVDEVDPNGHEPALSVVAGGKEGDEA